MLLVEPGNPAEDVEAEDGAELLVPGALVEEGRGIGTLRTLVAQPGQEGLGEGDRPIRVVSVHAGRAKGLTELAVEAVAVDDAPRAFRDVDADDRCVAGLRRRGAEGLEAVEDGVAEGELG